MGVCCIIGCGNRTSMRKKIAKNDKKVSYHRFPKDDRQFKWLQILQGISKLNTKWICSDHFKEDCFDKTDKKPRLKYNALPSIFSCCPENLKSQLEIKKYSFPLDKEPTGTKYLKLFENIPETNTKPNNVLIKEEISITPEPITEKCLEENSSKIINTQQINAYEPQIVLLKQIDTLRKDYRKKILTLQQKLRRKERKLIQVSYELKLTKTKNEFLEKQLKELQTQNNKISENSPKNLMKRKSTRNIVCF